MTHAVSVSPKAALIVTKSGLRERRLSRCDERLHLSLPLNKTSLTPFKTRRKRHFIDSEGAYQYSDCVIQLKDDQ